MPPLPSLAISSSLFFLVPLLLLLLAFLPNTSTPRPSMLPAQLIQTLIAVLAVLVATLGLAGLYKAETIVETLFAFVLQSTVVYIIASLSSFRKYAIASIILLSSATLLSFLSTLVQLPVVLNYISLILFISFCLATVKILFHLIFPKNPRSSTSIFKVDQLYNNNLDAVESGVPPVPRSSLKITLLVSFAGQFFFLLSCVLRLASLAFPPQDIAKQWDIKTALMILLIVSSLCSTYVFSKYACHRGLHDGNQKRSRIEAAPFGAFNTVNGLCDTSSGTLDAHAPSAALDVSGPSEASKDSITSDASITFKASMTYVASDANKRAYTNINSYSKDDDNNDSATLLPSPSVPVSVSPSRHSLWSRFIALAGRPNTSMASVTLQPPSSATDTAATSEACAQVNSKFTLDIGRPSLPSFSSSIPSIPSIPSRRSSFQSILSNQSVFGSINTLYTLPNDALSSVDITSATGVTGAMSTVTISATPFLHPAAATPHNSQNSHDRTTVATTYDMNGLVDYPDESDSREASIHQSLCPLSRSPNSHTTYSTHQDRILASDASLNAVVTTIPLLHPAATTFQTSQDKTILAYKHNMTTDNTDSVTNYGMACHADEIVCHGESIPDQSLCPLSRGLNPSITCVTNQNRALASDVSLDAVATTLNFDSGSTHLICHKESMRSLTSTCSASSASTTTLEISTTTTSMQSMHERPVSWSSSSVALPSSARRNVAMKMKMTGSISLGKCVPLDVLSRNFLQDEDEAGTESLNSQTPELEFSPWLDDNERPGRKRTKSRGSWGRSMSAAAAFGMGSASCDLPDVEKENVKKSRSSLFLFGGWGKLGGAREEDRTQDPEQKQRQGRGHRRQRSLGLSFSIGRVMRGRSLSFSFFSGLIKSRSRKDENANDEETQNVLGGDSETPSPFSGSGWGSGSPVLSSLSLTFSKSMTGSNSDINTSRSTLVTTSSSTTPNASPSSISKSQKKKANWKAIQGKKSRSMTMDDTHHLPADFMDMRDPFAPPSLGVRARTSPSPSYLMTPPLPHSSLLPTRVENGGRTKGHGRERGRNVSCPTPPCPTIPSSGSALEIDDAQQGGLLDVEEALLTQKLLMKLNLSPPQF